MFLLLLHLAILFDIFYFSYFFLITKKIEWQRTCNNELLLEFKILAISNVKMKFSKLMLFLKNDAVILYNHLVEKFLNFTLK